MRNELYQPVRTKNLSFYPPRVWTPTEVAQYVTGKGGTEATTSCSDGNGQWVPARPMNSFHSIIKRCKLAVAVFRGQADVLQWEQGQ